MTEFGQQIQLTLKAYLPEPVSILHNKAVQFLSQGDYFSATRLCPNEMENLTKSSGENYSEHVIPIHRTIYAKVGFITEDYKKAIGILDEVLLSQEAKWGKKHPILGATLNNLAVIYNKEEKYEEVNKLAKRTLDIYDQSKNLHDHMKIVGELHGLALYFNSQGKHEEEIRCRNRVVKIYEANLCANDPLVAAALNELAECYFRRGKFKDAEVIFKKVLSRAYEEESTGGNNKSKLSQMFTFKKDIRTKDSDRHVNIWKIAEERERSKKKLAEEVSPPVWNKPANSNLSSFNNALNALSTLYKMQGKHVAAKTLDHFANQLRIETAEADVEVNVVQNSNDSISSSSSQVASTSNQISFPSPPPLPPKLRARVRPSLFIASLSPPPLLPAEIRQWCSSRTYSHGRVPSPPALPPLPSPPSSPTLSARENSLQEDDVMHADTDANSDSESESLESQAEFGRTDIILQRRIPEPPALPSPPSTPPSSPKLPMVKNSLCRWKVSRIRNPDDRSPAVTRPVPQPRLLPQSSEQNHSLEQMLGDMQVEIAETTRRLAEAERIIETHAVFCCICLEAVANRMWSPCNHLAACAECATRLVQYAEEDRSDDGIACPKCRAPGRIFSVFI